MPQNTLNPIKWYAIPVKCISCGEVLGITYEPEQRTRNDLIYCEHCAGSIALFTDFLKSKYSPTKFDTEFAFHGDGNVMERLTWQHTLRQIYAYGYENTETDRVTAQDKDD